MALYLGYPISGELHARIEEAIRRVREEPPERNHKAFLTETIIGMTDTGVEFYLTEMVGRMRLGKAVDRIAAIALKTLKGGLHLIIDRVGREFSDEQYHPLVDFLEETVLEADGRVYVAFPATPELEAKLVDYLRLVREAPPATDHAWRCHDLIVEFKHTALDYFFRQSTQRLRVRGWAEKAVSLGIGIAHSASNRPLRRIVPSLSEQALVDIADFYGGIMVRQ